MAKRKTTTTRKSTGAKAHGRHRTQLLYQAKKDVWKRKAVAAKQG